MIDLRENHIQAVIKDLRHKEKKIKLPITHDSLEKALVEKDIVSTDSLTYTNFDMTIKSVLELFQVNNIKIKTPTNIYYLNLYLNLLKQQNINLDDDEIVEWNTEILKSKIADLLNTSIMNYDEFIDLLKNKESEATSENEETKENEVKDKSKEKPLYSISKLKKRHIERKGSNGKGTKK